MVVVCAESRDLGAKSRIEFRQGIVQSLSAATFAITKNRAKTYHKLINGNLRNFLMPP